jgi:hypothetical protein
MMPEAIMLNSLKVAAASAFLLLLPALAADLDPKNVIIKQPEQLTWRGQPGATQQTVLFGDPNKEGSLYGILIKWAPHTGSRPHTHPNDRFIYVISGTWWKGEGPKYDADSMVPIKAGGVLTDVGKGIHYDAARDEPVTLEIVGIGPATTTNAEIK